MPFYCEPCSVREMTECEIWWLAGLLEGEGCFTHNSYVPMIQVSMKDEDVIRHLHEITGAGKVYGPIVDRRPNHSPMYRWVVGRRLDAEKIMQEVYELMSARRQEQIMDAWNATRQSPRTQMLNRVREAAHV